MGGRLKAERRLDSPGTVSYQSAMSRGLPARVGGLHAPNHPPDRVRGVSRHHCLAGGLHLGSIYRQGRARRWIKVKNPKAPAVRREAEEDWGR